MPGPREGDILLRCDRSEFREGATLEMAFSGDTPPSTVAEFAGKLASAMVPPGGVWWCEKAKPWKKRIPVTAAPPVPVTAAEKPEEPSEPPAAPAPSEGQLEMPW